MSYKQIISMVSDIKRKKIGTINITVVSNITLELYFSPYLVKAFYGEGLYANIHFILYEDYSNITNKKILEKSDIVVVWLNYESLFPNILNDIVTKCKDADRCFNEIFELINFTYSNIRSLTNKQIIWIGFENYYAKENLFLGNIVTKCSIIDKLNIKINDINDECMVVIDLKRIMALIGIDNSYDVKNKYRWNCPYSQVLMSNVANEIHKQFCASKGNNKKCIVLDCDNVLWGGVVSEDGIENVILGATGIGRFYREFQKYILMLHEFGIILAICSKNDLDDILSVFNNNNEMILKESDISCFQVNWNNKIDNIMKISEMLNIGLDSIVFIDDSICEIESVKNSLPEVTTILYDNLSIYNKLNFFSFSTNIDRLNIKKRNITYKTNILREQLKSKISSYEEYLATLKTNILISDALPKDFIRISELTQRTNKCTNGKRYELADLKKMVSSEKYKLYSVYVSDKFGDLGLVGAIGVSQCKNNNTIDLFCLSCRALGRNIEKFMFDYIKKIYKINSFKFRNTLKNSEVLQMLKQYCGNCTIVY